MNVQTHVQNFIRNRVYVAPYKLPEKLLNHYVFMMGILE